MSPRKGALRILSAAGGVWALNVAIIVACAALLAGPVHDLPEFDLGVHITWWGLAFAFLAAERCVVHLHFRRSAHSFSLGDLPLVFGLLFAAPMDLVVAGLIGPVVVLLFDRKLPAIKFVFNIAQFTLTTCLAIIIFRSLAGTVEGFGPMIWIFALFADAGLGDHHRDPDRHRDLPLGGPDRGEGARAHARDGPHGHDHEREPRARRRRDRRLRRARAAAARRPARHRLPRLPRLRHRAPAPRVLQFLYETTRTLSRSPEIVVALRGPARPLRRGFRAEIAEIVLFPAEATRRCGRRSAPATPATSRSRSTRRSRTSCARWSTTTGPSPASPRPPAALRLRHYLEERGVRHAMLAMLPGETRVVGTMLLANRPGVVRDFSDADLRLFETLATNASVALQYDRLEQTVWQLRELQQQLEHQAFHDALTGLANRALFPDRVEQALARPRRTPARRRALRRPRRLQDRQRQPRPRGRRRAAGRGRRAAADAACARPTPSPGSAATSSRSCSRTPCDEPETRRRRRAHPRRRCAAPDAGRRRGRRRRRQHRHRHRADRARRAPASCCATPTSPCTAPRSAARAGATLFEPQHAAPRSLERLELEARARSRRSTRGELALALPADRRPRDRRASSASRRSCAGSTRSAGCVAAGRVHPAGRGDGPDRADRPLGARRGVPARGAAWHAHRDQRPHAISVNLSARQLQRRRRSSTRRRPRSSAHGLDAERSCSRSPRRVLMHDVDGAIGDAARAHGARRAPRDRRLRHRLLVAQLPAARSRSTSSRSTEPFVDGVDRAAEAALVVRMIIELGRDARPRRSSPRGSRRSSSSTSCARWAATSARASSLAAAVDGTIEERIRIERPSRGTLGASATGR